ncbi:MAG: AMP-binding protein [Deltaproteobacteria bacterium]|nr:AMP-binding protein [Deltaproteobacteria bacterium]
MNVVDYLFEKSKYLDKEFVCGIKETIRLGELYKIVNGLANYLKKNYKKGSRIVLCSDNSVFFIVAYLSIIKSNSIVVLTDTRISEKDIESICGKTEASAVFIQKRFQNKFNPYFAKYSFDLNNVFNENSIERILEKSKETHTDDGKTDNIADSDEIAVIIFTSATTGDKKGVMLSHRNIISNTDQIINYLKLTENDRIEVVLPFYYCYGTSLLHTHLRIGASMVLNKSIFVGSVLNEINKYKCTGFAGVPTTFHILIKKTDFLKTNFANLRYMTQAGGKLANKFIQIIIDSFEKQGIEFYVMYGATEATARLSYMPPELTKTKLGSIGKGIPGIQLTVLNKEGIQVKPGEMGEIVASGDNIMQGYYKDTEASAEVLKNGKYYTGDLATIDEDGFIYIVGRKNNIIKSAGYRVSPNEIQDTILELPEVYECAVLGIPDEIMGEAIVAVIESDEKSDEFKKRIIEYCNKKLPSFKVPRIIKLFKHIPLTTSNKKDTVKIKKILLNKKNGFCNGADRFVA